MPRISQLQSLTTADASDELAIVDTSASTTKKISKGDYLKDAATFINNASIPPQKLADGSLVLSYSEKNTNTTAFSTYVAVITSTVTIPTGVTRIELSGYIPKMSNNNNAQLLTSLRNGTTVIQETQLTATSGNVYQSSVSRSIDVIPGNTYTFSLAVRNDNNTLTVQGSASALSTFTIKIDR